MLVKNLKGCEKYSKRKDDWMYVRLPYNSLKLCNRTMQVILDIKYHILGIGYHQFFGLISYVIFRIMGGSFLKQSVLSNKKNHFNRNAGRYYANVNIHWQFTRNNS